MIPKPILTKNPETPSPSPNPSATPHDTLTKDKRTTAKEKVAPKTGDSMILIVSGLALVATAGGMGLVWKKENE
ncbi:LPXTG cell wall anchor domain-containing protein [Levyella massiliensis]|uniref:LPXTG cell wall anchor domain-containing protein n=1 Tax=Levyella massiliensis TaxID=938289 RepID=UPI0023F15287|nr:LPXTG cell wall anchor domain-containing protein [Levyella massiliensis]